MAMYDAGGSKLIKQGNGQPEGEMDALLLGITKELVASTPSRRNYKGILIALLVICAVCGLILLAIYLLRPPDDGPRVKGRKITLDDLSSKRFLLKPFNGTWITENEILFQDDLDRISIFNSETLTSNLFVANTTFRRLKALKFTVSPDRKFILFTHDVRPVWEHSSLAKYTAYDVEQQLELPINPTLGLKIGGSNKSKTKINKGLDLQYAEWGPQGHALIIIHNNDIYYKPSPNSSQSFQLTSSGQSEIIFNGIPDWLYEAEILKSPSAVWVSPDGKFLLYASFNDTLVGEASFPWYGENSPYPELRTFKYPKAGTTNPIVKLCIIELDSNEFRPFPLQNPISFDLSEHYVTSMKWIDKIEISIVLMNRQHNTAIFATCKYPDWQCKEIYILKPPGIGWLDFPDAPIFAINKSSCLLRIPWRDGEAGYFQHIVWLDIQNGKEIPVTSGPFEVTEISAWDQTNQIIYFIAVPMGKPGERHLYSVAEKSSNSSVIVSPICLTCENNIFRNDKLSLTEVEASFLTEFYNSSFEEQIENNCLYNQISFSSSNKFFIRECLGPGIPTTTLHRAPSGEQAFVLDNNSALKKEVGDLALPVLQTLQIETSSGYVAQVKLYLPPGFRENEDFKFPFVLHINGAPGSQLVSKKWEISWATYLSSQKNFVVAEIDGRGTGFQGENIRQAVHKNLGSLEIIDQLEVIHSLRGNKTFVDEKNMAVWGWGFGGHLSLLALALDTNKLFQCGITVAPITKWEFYDTVYAERYLGSPNYTENYHGYENGDLIRIVKNLNGQNFLIVHGTADEIVHYQHTLHLTKELIKEGISFTEQVYPDEGHKLSGVTDHMYTTMENFLESCFEKPDWEDWEKANFLGIPM